MKKPTPIYCYVSTDSTAFSAAAGAVTGALPDGSAPLTWANLKALYVSSVQQDFSATQPQDVVCSGSEKCGPDVRCCVRKML
mmetsp:Transcript_21112/g.48747  ORF Transcript_21112/g.48747 Transcript_21112/m.48747 type:complete len:82 (-) Transcript_21112:609-854(-)